MKLKKILAGVAASAMAVSTMVIASADATNVSFNTPFTMDVDKHATATITLAGILQADTDANPNAGWNDWCCLQITSTDANGNKTYAAVIGGSVTWDITVDDNGTKDDDTDDIKIAPADGVIMYGDCTEDATVEIEVFKGGKLEVKALGWDSNPDEPYFMVKDVTLAELPEEKPEEKPDGDTKPEEKPDDNKPTGLAGLALAGLAVSGAAVVATKKRK